MNLLELRTQTRLNINETTAAKSRITDTEINLIINEAIKDACIKGSVYEKTQTFPVLTTIAGYVLPWDFLRPVSVKNPTLKDLALISENVSGETFVVTGKPTSYYIRQSPIIRTVRANLTIYYKGEYLLPATSNGYMYEVVSASGLSGAAPPTYPVVPGNSVADGDLSLTCRELAAKFWSIVLVDTPTTAGGGTGTYTLTYYAIDEGLYTDTDCPNFPIEKHPCLVDYTCWRILSGKFRQQADSMGYLMNYLNALGIKMEDYMGSSAQQLKIVQ